MKFRCLNPECGHEFTGDPYTTQSCPKCGNMDIEEVKTKFPKWLNWVIVGVAALIILLLMPKGCQKEGTLYVEADMEDPYNIVLQFKENGEAPAKNVYIVRVFDEDGEVVDSCYVRESEVRFAKDRFTGDQVTYTFNVYRIDNSPFKIHWKGPNSFTTEAVPKAPMIRVEPPIGDIGAGTYTITVVVDSGDVSQFVLYYYSNGNDTSVVMRQKDPIFKNVQPTGKYRLYVRALGTNGLWSEEKQCGNTSTRPVPPPKKLSKSEIDDVLNAVARQEMTPGRAIEKLRGSVKENIEDKLQESYATGVKATIKYSND